MFSPRIVLIGGKIRLSDGRGIDSCVSAQDSESDRAVHCALTSSADWWTIAASVAKASLEKPSPTPHPLHNSFILTTDQHETAAKAQEKRRTAFSVAKTKREQATSQAVSALQSLLKPDVWEKTAFSLVLPLTKPTGKGTEPLANFFLRFSRMECQVTFVYKYYNQINFRRFNEGLAPKRESIGNVKKVDSSWELFYRKPFGYFATQDQLETIAVEVRNAVPGWCESLQSFLLALKRVASRRRY